MNPVLKRSSLYLNNILHELVLNNLGINTDEYYTDAIELFDISFLETFLLLILITL